MEVPCSRALALKIGLELNSHMPEKPVVEIPVVSVSKITVSGDPGEGALVKFETEADADVELILPPAALAQLEALLARAAQEQSKHHPQQ